MVSHEPKAIKDLKLCCIIMLNLLRKLVFLFFLFNLTPLQSVAEENDKTLTFGIYGYLESHSIYSKFGPFRDYIESELISRGWDITVNAKVYSSYQEAIEELAEGNIDFTRFGPVSYVLAKEMNQNIQLLAMEDNFGSKYFEGVIFVKNDSHIKTLADLKGSKMAFGSINSTTGRYLAQLALKKVGINGANLGSYDYLGKHDAVALSVNQGNHDAGAANENTFNKFKVLFGLRAITTFPCVTKPWIAKEGMNEKLFKAVQTILLEIDDKELLQIIKRSGLTKSEDSNYDSIREAMAAGADFP